eukprot:GHVO01005342.1.p1 GENE.GHVO01005342.1~~GHVO01005342.1.p1  ORF type:complete len:216 (+),score=59.29 GHVO01005342.1:148-795(+)
MEGEGYRIEESVEIVEPRMDVVTATSDKSDEEMDTEDMQIGPLPPPPDEPPQNETIMDKSMRLLAILDKEEDISEYDRDKAINRPVYLDAIYSSYDDIQRKKEEELLLSEASQKDGPKEGQLPVGFFDDVDKDAVARGMHAPSKIAESQAKFELEKLEYEMHRENQVEEIERHAEDATNRTKKFEEEIDMQTRCQRSTTETFCQNCNGNQITSNN